MKYLIAIFVALISTTVVADTSRAIIIDEGWCGNVGLVEGDYVIVYNYTEKKRVIASHSVNGNVTLVCEGRDIPNDTGRAWQWQAYNIGMMCGFRSPHGVIVTDQAHYTLTPNGIARTTCHFDMNSLQ